MYNIADICTNTSERHLGCCGIHQKLIRCLSPVGIDIFTHVFSLTSFADVFLPPLDGYLHLRTCNMQSTPVES